MRIADEVAPIKNVVIAEDEESAPEPVKTTTTNTTNKSGPSNTGK
jgi:hypothetical protein